MTDYCKFVDPFYGNGEVDHFPETGLASKWFFIKAQCGNTLPHAVLPFGRMSVGAYSGGYPTGYGNHYPNTCGAVRKMWDEMQVRGFSHLHQFGTGAMQFYYNYAIVTPFYGALENAFAYRSVRNERAVPGCYAVDFEDVQCRLTTTADTACHSYHFLQSGGRIAVDFSNDGLSRMFEEKYHGTVQNAKMHIQSPDTVLMEGVFSGIPMAFCVRVKGENVRCSLFEGEQFGAVFDFDKDAQVLVACSPKGTKQALAFVEQTTDSFEVLSEKAYAVWNEHLSRIQVDGTEEMKRKFYTNLYHSLIKPCDRSGEDVPVSDIATFWDQYKTALPLIYTVYPEMGKKIAEGIVKISRDQGQLLCSVGLSTIQPCEEQAKMLGVITLCDAYYAGLCNEKDIEECIRREFDRADYESFHRDGVFERYTHILDVADACYDVATITQDEGFKAQLLCTAQCMRTAYGEDGLLSENSPYYEGDRYTYSFRLHGDMETRLAIAGGKERYGAMLDDFFAFEKESVPPVRDLEGAPQKIAATKYHRFQGYNNEPDMEVPYGYIFAGQHEKLCRIINESTRASFTEGRGGLPGNNDSGGLTSCFVWNVLGLFPMAGTGKFLVGCPQMQKATLNLAKDKTLTIEVQGEGETVQKVLWNGKAVTDYIIPAQEIYAGGVLQILR